jgi:hypothetical protein
MRIVALVGLVAVLGLGGFVFVFGHKQPAGDSGPALSAADLIKRAHANGHVTAPTKPVPKKHAAATTKPAAHAKTRPAVHAKKPAVHAKAKPKAQPKPKPKPKVTLYQNLPSALLGALQRNDVVVVSIFNPKAPDDQIAVAEAQAGAHDAGVGFLTLNVLEQSDVALITKTYGLIDDPAVLVFRRPGVVVGRLNGFADRVTVAQAVENNAPGAAKSAAPAMPSAETTPAWVRQANAACLAAQAKYERLDGAERTKQLPKIMDERIAGLRAVTPPASKRTAFTKLIQARELELLEEKALRAATDGHDTAAATDAAARERAANKRARALARSLGLTGCA